MIYIIYCTTDAAVAAWKCIAGSVLFSVETQPRKRVLDHAESYGSHQVTMS